MLDQTLELQMKIMYSFNENYADHFTRSVNIDISQVKSDYLEKDINYQMKYRFLHVTDTGDLVPIYNSAQS